MKKYLSLLIVLSMLSAMLTGFTVQAEKSVSEPVTAETVQSTAVHGSDVLITAGKDPSCYNLTWTSAAADQEYIQWTETERLVNGTMPADCNTMTAIKDTATTCTYTARGQMTALESDTSYSYRVGSDTTGWSPVYTFDLSDKTDGAFSFILAGDPQIGAGALLKDTKAWNTTLANVENWFGDDIDFLMTAGDHVNKHANTAQYQGFADP
ncbi:MAG: fibronectin type III domain-containing protein, partial [Clostridia bacterium]|nr:fibronectin type III domain-containing protein [Clostridia bacterium]